MAKLDYIIGLRKYELIRNRIGEILADELAHQYDLTADPNLKAPVYIERTVPISTDETPIINILTVRGDYGSQDAASTLGNYQYYIDCYASSKTKGTDRGDYLASVYVQRLTGVIQAILENPVYRTLGYAAPFNASICVKSIYFPEPITNDTESLKTARIEVVVEAPEENKLIEPTLIASYTTQVKLGQTDKGYRYEMPMEGFLLAAPNVYLLINSDGGRLKIS